MERKRKDNDTCLISRWTDFAAGSCRIINRQPSSPLCICFPLNLISTIYLPSEIQPKLRTEQSILCILSVISPYLRMHQSSLRHLGRVLPHTGPRYAPKRGFNRKAEDLGQLLPFSRPRCEYSSQPTVHNCWESLLHLKCFS